MEFRRLNAQLAAFVQQVSTHGTAASIKLTPTSAITAGNRIVVVVGVWNSGAATAKTVTDSAGNTYTEVLHFKASENTEESVWTAPITAGGGTKPVITVTPTSTADVGAIASEYSGLSTAPGTGAIDQIASKSGTTSGAATVSSGRHGGHQRVQRAGHRDVCRLGLRRHAAATQSAPPTTRGRPAAYRPRRETERHRDLDRSLQRRGPDHQLHRDPGHRDDGPDGDHRERDAPGHQRDRHRPLQRHRLHVHGHRRQQRRHRSGPRRPPTASRRPRRAPGPGDRS